MTRINRAAVITRNYPFIPLNVIPSINNRCDKKKTITIGNIVTNEAAIK